MEREVQLVGGKYSEPGWNAIGVRAGLQRRRPSPERATTVARLRRSLPRGSGFSTCRGTYADNDDIPLQLLVFSPPSKGTWKLAAPSYQASQQASGNCSQVSRALDDTCDPPWNGPFPGEGENSPLAAQLSLNTKLVLDTKSGADKHELDRV